MILFKKLWHFVYLVTGEGSWSLRPYETAVIKAVLGSLEVDIRQKIEKQLRKSYFVERTNKHVNVIRFYDMEDHLRVFEHEVQDSLFKVSTRLEGKVYDANVTFYKGLIFSVETKKAGGFYVGKGFDVINVKKGSPSHTVTKAIDRLEHGDEQNQ